MFELLDGKGSEIGIINLLFWGIYLLAKKGILKKVKIFLSVKIGSNGTRTGILKTNSKVSDNPGHNPGSLNGSVKVAVARLDERIDNIIKRQDKTEENNREDHQLIFGELKEIRDKIK